MGLLDGVAETVRSTSSSLLGPVDPSFGALSGRLKFTVRRHECNKDSFLTGESADAKYAKLAESKNNFIFLDLEMTHGFYDPLSASSRILEVYIKRE